MKQNDNNKKKAQIHILFLVKRQRVHNRWNYRIIINVFKGFLFLCGILTAASVFVKTIESFWFSGKYCNFFFSIIHKRNQSKIQQDLTILTSVSIYWCFYYTLSLFFGYKYLIDFNKKRNCEAYRNGQSDKLINNRNI